LGRSDVLGGGGELVEAAARGHDDERDLGVAQHGELVRLLEEAVPALGEGDLAARGVLDPAHLAAAAAALLLHPAGVRRHDLPLVGRRRRRRGHHRSRMRMDLPYKPDSSTCVEAANREGQPGLIWYSS